MNSKPATQNRSRDKRERILTALEILLAQQSFAEITVSALARAAEVPVATLYQRFHNTDVMGSILLALYYERMEEWARRPRPAPVSAELGDSLRRLAADGWDQIQALGHIMRPAYLHSRLHPERAGPEWRQLEQLARDGFRAFLRAHAHQLAAVDLDRAGGELAFVVDALMLGPLLHGEDPQWRAADGREVFVSTVAAVVERYLTCPRSEAPAP